MKRRTSAGILLIVIAMLSIGVVAEGTDPMTIHIDVAPNTLNLESNGNGVTVHTNITFNTVNCSSVTLEVEEKLITIRNCYSDLCGDLVVKVDRVDVVDAIEDPNFSPTKAIFTLNGNTTDTISFTGTDTIDVIDVAQSGSQK